MEEPSWSFDENQLLYIAEELKPTLAPDENDEPIGSAELFSYFSYKEDFGETFSGKGRPRLFLLDIKTRSVSDITPMEAQYEPNVDSLKDPIIYYNVLEVI